MNANPFSYSLTAALLGLASPAATAQQCDFTPIGNGIEQRLDLIGNSHGDSCTGEYTGDGVVDVAVITDGALVVFHSPAEIDYSLAPVTLGNSVTSLCTLRGGGPGGIDALVGSDAGGLLIWKLDVLNSELLPQRVPNSLSAVNASSLAAMDINADGYEDILVVNAARNQVSFWYSVGGVSFSEGFTYSTSTPIIDALVGDWDATSSDLELLLVYGQRLSVVETQTSLELESLSFIGTAEEAVILREVSAGPGFAVAVLEARPTGIQWLTLWRAGGQSEIGIDLGTMGVVGLTASDGDGNGNEDPVVAATSLPWLILFPNFIGLNGITHGPSLDVAVAYASVYADTGDDLSGQVSPPLAADFDGDGDLDAAIACTGNGTLFMALNGLLIQESLMRPEFYTHTSQIGEVISEADLESEEFSITVSGNLPQVVPANFTHIEFELREQDQVDAIDRASLVLPGPGASFSVTLGSGLSSNPGIGGAYVVAHFAERADATTLRVGPATIGFVDYGGPCVSSSNACFNSCTGTATPAPLPKPIVPPRTTGGTATTTLLPAVSSTSPARP